MHGDPRPAAQEHSPGFWSEGWRRLRRNRLAVVSLFVVGAMVVLGYCAPLLSRWVTHFSLDEQHSQLAYAPPGSRDVSIDHPSYGGDPAWFDVIDTDGDGVLACALEPAAAFDIPSLRPLASLPLAASAPGGPTSVYEALLERARTDTALLDVPLEEIFGVQLGRLHCPELDRLRDAWRFYDFLFANFDTSRGQAAPDPRGLVRQPDGFVSRVEFPSTDDQIDSAFRGVVKLGDEGFELLDLNGNGYISPSELVSATRYLRFDPEHLLATADRNRDLRIARAEFPGIPETHPFWLGTDGKGRDLLTRMVYGARISITIGVLATLVSFFIGVSWGAIAGYYGGRVDNAMMRVVDVLYGLPFMFLVILLIVFTGRSTVNLFIALGAVQWLTMARVVRGQVLSLRHREFVEAAEALGVGRLRIVFRHLLRNTVGPVIVYSTLMVPAVIKEEAFLSFLGLGVQPPDPSWGNLISEGATKLESYWWLILYPGLMLAITLFCMNFLGDGARDALDPQLKKR